MISKVEKVGKFALESKEIDENNIQGSIKLVNHISKVEVVEPTVNAEITQPGFAMTISVRS